GNVRDCYASQSVELSGRPLGLEDAETSFRRSQLRTLLQVLHLHGIQLQERERLRKTLRHTCEVRRKQSWVRLWRGCQHRTNHSPERHPRESADQLIQLHHGGLGCE